MSAAAPPYSDVRQRLRWLQASTSALSAWWEEAKGAGWRGPLLAALVVLVSALPGLLTLPPLDRDESRFAQATAQMLETGDPVNIRFQDQARDKKPVGIHWLQAASVALFSAAEARDIRPYRLPSLLGAMLAAAACAWGAAAAYGPRGGTVAGCVLGAGLLLSSEAFIGKTDAVLCGVVTLAMAGLGRLYLQANGSTQAGRGGVERWALWGGLALGILVKGPVAPMVVGLTVAALAIADRRARWIGRLGWSWGPLVVLLVCAPWAFAITVATDGGFWTGAVGGDIAPKIAGAHETHGGLPGLHVLLAPVLSFPSGFLLPAAAVAGWRRRQEPATRFALAWLVPAWIAFELMPTKLPHYPLPLYGALAWLIAAAATGWRIGARTRMAGAALGAGAAIALCVVTLWAAQRYGGGGAATAEAALVSALALASAALGGVFLLRARPILALATAGAAGVAAHIALSALLLPNLTALWTSAQAADLMARTGLDPRDGRIVGPVAVAGYAEPSLVFALGTETELDDRGAFSAESLALGAPALIEDRQEADFRARLAKLGVVGLRAGEVRGYDYSSGQPVRLTLWRPLRLPPPPSGDAP